MSPKFSLESVSDTYESPVLIVALTQDLVERGLHAGQPLVHDLRRRLFQVFSIGSMVGATIGVVGAGVSATLCAGTR